MELRYIKLSLLRRRGDECDALSKVISLTDAMGVMTMNFEKEASNIVVLQETDRTAYCFRSQHPPQLPDPPPPEPPPDSPPLPEEIPHPPQPSDPPPPHTGGAPAKR